MAVFDPSTRFRHRLDWMLLQGGAVTLYTDRAQMEEHLQQLTTSGYWRSDFDLSRPRDDVHARLVEELQLADYCRPDSSDSLADCLLDIVVPERGGRVLAMWAVEQVSVDALRYLLAPFERASREFSLQGRQLIVLLHSNDRRLHIGEIWSVQVKYWKSVAEMHRLRPPADKAP
jgi:hypothetical protein